MKKFLFLFVLCCFFHSKIYAQVNAESYRINDDSLGLSLKADLDLTLMTGNTDFQYFGENTRFNYNWGKHYILLVVTGGFGRNQGSTFFSQGLIHARNVNSLVKSLHLEEFMQYDNNKSLLLLDRYLAGAGLRYKVLDLPAFVSHIGTSIFAEIEEYDLQKADKHAVKAQAFRLSTYLTLKVQLQNNIHLLSVTYLQPDIQRINDLKLLSDHIMVVQLSKTIGLTVKLEIRHDSRPADNIKEFDLISKTGMTINF